MLSKTAYRPSCICTLSAHSFWQSCITSDTAARMCGTTFVRGTRVRKPEVGKHVPRFLDKRTLNPQLPVAEDFCQLEDLLLLPEVGYWPATPDSNDNEQVRCQCRKLLWAVSCLLDRIGYACCASVTSVWQCDPVLVRQITRSW